MPQESSVPRTYLGPGGFGPALLLGRAKKHKKQCHSKIIGACRKTDGGGDILKFKKMRLCFEGFPRGPRSWRTWGFLIAVKWDFFYLGVGFAVALETLRSGVSNGCNVAVIGQ